MPLSNDALDAAAAALAARYPYGNFTSSVPTGSGATETSGSARRQLTWSKTGTGVQTATISDTAANLGVGTTIAGGAYFTAANAGTYGGGAGITSRTLQSGDSITVTLTINAASQS